MGRVFLWGDITEESICSAIRQMRYIFFANKLRNLYVYIHSCGGCWDACFTMIDEMNGLHKLGANICTVALGKAYSSGALILSAGNERYATANANLMLHPMSYDSGDDYIHQQSNYADYLKRLYHNGMTIIAKNCGYETKKEIDSFMDKIKDGLWMDAKEAINFGLIDNIWDYRWEREITGLEYN